MMCRRSEWIKTAVLTLAVTLLFVLPAFAGFKEDVARDLGVKTATLVAPAGSEWLIDLDAASGVQAGDLFVVVTKGSPVVHPVTKKVIGSIDETRALLRVTKVKAGYSYATVVGAAGDLKAGDEARRFAGLPALFWDYSGDGEGVFTQLQGALPELHWQSYAAAQAGKPDQPRPVPNMEPGLIFVFNDKGLGVKDQAFQPLRFYRPDQVSGKVAVVTAAAMAAPAGASIVTPGSPAAAPTPGTLPGGSGSTWMPKIFGGASSSPPGPGGVLAGSGSSSRGGLIVSQMDSREGVWYGPRMEGKPVGVEVGDLDGDGKNEVALGFRDRVVVSRIVAGKFEPMADYSFGSAGAALNLEGVDLDGNGRMELYITLALVNDLRSIAIELQGGQLAAVVKPAPYFLRKMKLGDQDHVLLGQDLNQDLKNYNQDLAGPIFRVTRSGDHLERGAPVDFPKGMSLPGLQPFETTGRPLIARLNINDKLQVLEPAGGVLWESSDYFGGSETSFERPDGLPGGATRYAFISPRLEPGPEGTVLVPVNEGNRNFSAFRSFNSSHLKAVAYDGYSLVERWRTKPQGGYMGDFRMADADNDGAPEIVMLVMFSHGGLGYGDGSSALLIYEMQ
ncbi:MAG: VCBS repeat-containing protein [Desulfuromonas sp.]|nr:VCBS repeat-containing protein [Desulfuromonas sp.]